MHKGLVIKSTGSWFTVRDPEGRIVNCKIKGTYRIKGIRATNPVAVGDRVEYLMEQGSDNGLITKIEVRKNYIKTVTLNVPLYKLNEAVIAEIEKMSKNNKGKSLLKFNVYDPDTNMNIHMFSRTSKINFSDEFLTFFENDSDITFRIN